MSENKNLNIARQRKSDEFYTSYEDVEKEIKYYTEHFKDKKVLCNCNDTLESAFTQYFLKNFDQLGLKKLTCVTYDKDTGISYVLEKLPDQEMTVRRIS